jgi:hypothetical protein
MTYKCPNCITLEAALIRSQEAHLKDKVAFQVERASPKYGVRPTAPEDLRERVWNMGEWREENGRIVLWKNGTEERNAAFDVITPEIAVRDLVPDAPHFFNETAGTQKAGDTGPNPFIRGPHFNLTKQAEILRVDPARAKRLAAEAGIELAI